MAMKTDRTSPRRVASQNTKGGILERRRVVHQWMLMHLRWYSCGIAALHADTGSGPDTRPDGAEIAA
jgi:hypothetical protein